MWLTIIYRVFVFFIVFAYISCFGGCTQPVKTDSGMAFDKKTLLEDLGNGVCRQLPSGLMWQIDESKKIENKQVANEYANSLELAGYDDWRLPTRGECLSFSELLFIKKEACPIKFKRAHWVTDPKEPKPGYWEEYPLCGGSEFLWQKGKKGTVRAVRP